MGSGSKKPLRVLCLDIEGGHGGSSRSLYESLRFMDKDKVFPEVWCRRDGKIRELYGEIGIKCFARPDMPKVTSVKKNLNNAYVYMMHCLDFIKNKRFRDDLVREVNARFDLVHFNHESLFLLAKWLRKKCQIPFTMHIRTNLYNTIFARWQMSVISRVINRLVFITETEKANFERLGGSGNGKVVYNIVSPPAKVIEPLPQIPRDQRFKIASLSNFSWLRGTDRLVDIADNLMRTDRGKKCLFVVAGDMNLSASLPGEMGKIARGGGTLKEYVNSRGFSDNFFFLGHVENPWGVIAACDVLIKPTRDNNPWGRDILEAMIMEKPVITCGKRNRFVQYGENGFNMEKYSAEEFAKHILLLADDPELRAKMGVQAKEHISMLCDGPTRAAELLSLWRDAAFSR